MGYGLDSRGADWRDDDAVHFHEADRECWECSRPIPTGVRCTGCWIVDDGAAADEGGEAG
jgi:hypothetical protein